MSTSSDVSRQYGGYGGYGGGGLGYGGYGGFVECCEGVVDPLFLLTIIAGEQTLSSLEIEALILP